MANGNSAWARGDSSRDISLTTYTDVVGLGFDDVDIYFGSRTNNIIYKVNPSTKVVSEFLRLGDIFDGDGRRRFQFRYSGTPIATKFNSSPTIDSLSFGDSKLWIGDDRNKLLISFNSSGGDTEIHDLPSNITPSGIAHPGDTGALPWVLDSTAKKIISYQEKKRITQPIIGDSHQILVDYPLVNVYTPVTKYRVIGDNRNVTRYASCTNVGDSELIGATRYRASETLYDSGDSAIAAASYSYLYNQVCLLRTETYNTRRRQPVKVPKDPIIQYRVIGERRSGTSSFSCSSDYTRNGRTFTFTKTRTRYRQTGWFSTQNEALNASRHSETVRESVTAICVRSGVQPPSHYCPSGAHCITVIQGRGYNGGMYYLPPSPIPLYQPRYERREVPQEPGDSFIWVGETGTRTANLKNIESWSPSVIRVGDTLVTQEPQRRERRIPVKVVRTPGDSTIYHEWDDQISSTDLLKVSQNIRPTGLSFGPQNNLYVLDANQDTAWAFNNGTERTSNSTDFDINSTLIRGVNSNIFPGAIVWNRIDAVYISDTQAKKLWVFESTELAELNFDVGPITIDFEADIAGVDIDVGPISIDFEVEKYIFFSGFEYDIGPISIDFQADVDRNPIAFDFDVGPVGIDFEAEIKDSVNFPFDIDVGPIGIDFEAIAEQEFEWEINTGLINIDFDPNFRVFLNFGDIDVGPVTLDFDLDAIESPEMDLNVGPVSIDFEAEKRNSVDFPFDIDVGPVSIDFEAYQAGIEDSFSLDINIGGISLDFEAEAFTPVNKYFYMNYDVGPITLDFEAVEAIQAPNLLNDNVPAVELPITIPAGDTQESELSKYKAVGRYQWTTERVGSARTRTGDEISNEYEIPWADREPTILSEGTPQLLPPTLRVVHQGNAFALHGNEQTRLRPTKIQLQVSENENGPWFAIDHRDNNEFKTGDSGGYSESEGFEHVLTNIPLKGTEDVPEPRTLCYRARRVDVERGERSDWSTPVAVTAQPIQKGQYGSKSISASKFVNDLFGRQGVGNKIAYWSMDDTAGENPQTPSQLGFMQDTSEEGVPVPLRIKGREITGDTGIKSKAIFIDGYNNDSYAITNKVGTDGDSWSELSMMCFIKDDIIQPQNVIGLLSYYVNENDFINLSYVKSARVYRVRVGDTYVLNSDPITLLNQNWKQIGFNYNAKNKKLELWLDGVLLKSEIIGHNKDYIPQGGYFAVGGLIGKDINSEIVVGNKFRGLIDEARVWKRILSLEEFVYFRNYPKGVGATEFITPDKILDGSLTAEKFAAGVVEALLLRIHGSIKTGVPVDVSSGVGYRSHIDGDDISLQKLENGVWTDQVKIRQDANNGYFSINGDLGNLEITPNVITITRGTARSTITPRKVGIQHLIEDQWIERSALTRNRLVFRNTEGEETTSMGSRINVGDSINFGDYLIHKEDNVNHLTFSGEIRANSIIPQTTITGGINQNDLFLLLEDIVTTTAKTHGYGILKITNADNIAFEGPLIFIEKKSPTIFNIFGFNTNTKASQTIILNRGSNSKVFDDLTMEV